jgi:DNA-binding transcriptional MerR regulator
VQKQKIKMGQKKFRIGELSEQLNIKKFVIRFWEKEFGLTADRSSGGQRFYTQEDFNTFVLIKDLLYQKKFTIPGARKELDQLKNKRTLTPAIKQEFTENKKNEIPEEFYKKLSALKKQLTTLQNQL